MFPISFPKMFPKQLTVHKKVCIIMQIWVEKKQISEYYIENLHKWCGRQELNLHGVTHKILSLARLPVPPRPH